MATPRKTHPMILVAAASGHGLSLTGVAVLPAGCRNMAARATADGAAAAVLLQKRPGLHPHTRPMVPRHWRFLWLAHHRRAEGGAARPVRSEARPVASAPQEGGYTRVSQPVNDNGIYVENARPATAPALVQAQNTPQPYGQQPAICNECGTVESVREISNIR